MSAELSAGEVFTDVSPGKTVTSTKLNNHVNGASVQPGALSNRTELAANGTAAADFALVWDATDSLLKKVQLQNLLPETVRQSVQSYIADTGAANAYVATLSPAATAYTAGMFVVFKAANANTTASTLNVNGLGAKNIFTRAGAALAANDILASQIVVVVYDGTQFQLVQALSAGEVTATHCAEATRQGVHQYIADSGAADAYVATLAPAATAYTAGMIVRFKAANANTGAATVNVNALGAKNLKKIVAGAVAALVARDIQVADIVTAIYDGTQFIILARSWDFTSAATTIPGSSGVATIAHSLGAKPTKVRAVLMNNTAAAEQGYAQNDEIDLAEVEISTDGNVAFSVCVDATNITVVQRNSANLEVMPKTGGAPAGITSANWAIKVFASL